MRAAVLITMLGFLTSTAMAEQATWLTDLKAAKTTASQEKKQILINFTGSDWCPWCIKLQKEIFSQPQFVEYARKNLVLVEVDFPRTKPQSNEVKKANDLLSKEYDIKGFPTLIVLNSQGKRVGELGYMPGGPKAFLAKLESLK